MMGAAHRAVWAFTGWRRWVLIAATLAGVAAASLAAVAGASSSGGNGGNGNWWGPPPAVQTMLSQISSAKLQADDAALVGFGTRHSLSSQTDPNRGIGAAASWITQQLQAIAAT